MSQSLQVTFVVLVLSQCFEMALQLAGKGLHFRSCDFYEPTLVYVPHFRSRAIFGNVQCSLKNPFRVPSAILNLFQNLPRIILSSK